MLNLMTARAIGATSIIFLTQLLYLIHFHSWEVDPHHDGIMFTAAVAASEGKVPNRDFFAQYGPGSPFIQGIWLQLTSTTLFQLKVFTSLCLSLTALLVFLGARNVVSLPTAALLSYLWALTGPFGLPWSSVITTLFLTVSLVLVYKSYSSGDKESLALLFIVGIILAVGFFTRVHIAAVYFALNLGIWLDTTPGLRRRRISAFNIGFLSTFTLISLILHRESALWPFIEQCIVWASQNYVGAPELSVSLVADLAWIPLIGFLGLFMIYLIYKRSSSFEGSQAQNFSLLAFSSLSLFFLAAVYLSDIERSGEQTLRNPRILLIIAGEKFQLSFSYLVIALFLLVISLKMRSLALGHKSCLRSNFGFPATYLLFALATSLQLYPYADAYHIAFIIPILILSSLFSISKSNIKDSRERAFRLFGISLIPMLLFNYAALANVSRYEFQSKTLKGMHGSWLTARSLDATLLALQEQEPGIRFNCPDGIYAGAGGKYLSIDRSFVNWGPASDSGEKDKRVFLCYANNETIEHYTLSGWTVVFKELWRPINDFAKESYWNVLLYKE